MLKKNDEVVVKIERYGDNGEGIAIFDGKVVFVPFTVVGEEVRVHIIFDKGNFFVGKAVEIVVPSPQRVIAPCPYFKVCGGCDIQHINYTSQLELKRNMVANCLKKYAGLDCEVSNTIQSEHAYRYRNKFAFPVQEVGGEIKIGMYRKNSHEVVDIEDCLLQSGNTKQIISIFKDYLIKNKISAYNPSTGDGIVKHIVVRENESSFILTIVVMDEKFKNFAPLIEKLKENFNNFSIIKNVNKLNNNVIFGNFDQKIYGEENLQFEEFGIKYFVNNRSFLQVNDGVKKKIYEKIIEMLEGEKLIIDAYSGAGLLSAILSKVADKVIGIEIVKEATKNANLLKKINNLTNLSNINGDCAVILPKLAEENRDFSLVLDPPRKGVDGSVIGAIIKARPKKIVYLSCNPATLARDLKALLPYYSVRLVQPYDMFPQTANVETLIILKIKSEEK